MKKEIQNLKNNDNGKTNYLTHNFHTYPAKYIPQIPRYFIEKYTNEGDLVYDPFLGCGTTLVECKLLNRDGIGVDLNPIATLVSKVKTQPLKDSEIELIKKFIDFIENGDKVKKKKEKSNEAVAAVVPVGTAQPNNTPGMGNAAPPSAGNVGSGDRFDSSYDKSKTGIMSYEDYKKWLKKWHKEKNKKNNN